MKFWNAISGWIALLLGLSCLFIYIVAPHQTLAIASLGGIAGVNALVYIISERAAIQRGIKSRTAVYGMNTVILFCVFLGVLIFVNLLSTRHKHRFDFTASGIFTLAPQTKKIVSNLPREVTLTAFFQGESPIKADFKNLMDGYLDLSNKVALTFVDPDKNPAIVKQYGITTYGTVVLESGKQETKVQNPKEESITNAILKVTRDEKKKIYFLEGHGERDPDNTEALGYSAAKQALERDGFAVEKLLLLKTANVPGDADALVIAGPEKPLLPEEQKALEAFLQKGGSILLLVDPQAKTGMEDFLSRWGIGLREDIVIDPMSKLFGGDYAAPVVSQYMIHDITRNFSLPTIFPVLRSVTAKKMDGLKVDELLQTGANSWAELDFSGKKVKFDEGVDQKGPVTIAVIASKKTDPEKNPPPNEDGTQNDKKDSPKQGNLMVLGDSDFANNTYFNFSGNGDFFLNTASWLAEEETLISIRPKERKDTPIHLTSDWGSAIFLLGTIIFPGVVVSMGIRNWWTRRRL
jgi:gliding motility-associatede transport system auxiliary component